MALGNLIVISGPSGAGKGTLVDFLKKERSDIALSISATTRPPRSGEQEGASYFFLSDEDFDVLIKEDGLLEWAQVHLHRYGTPKAFVLDKINQGLQVILEIDVQGALQVRARYPEAKLIFIEPPSLEVLEGRLRNRATELEDAILKRLSNARLEIEQKIEYDYVLVNDNLEKAKQELLDIVAQIARNEDKDIS